MTLNVAVQMDPIERINIRGDSTFALLLEAQRRGHTLAYYTPDRLALRDGRVHAAVQPLQVRDQVGDHATLGPAEHGHPSGPRTGAAVPVARVREVRPARADLTPIS